MIQCQNKDLIKQTLSQRKELLQHLNFKAKGKFLLINNAESLLQWILDMLEELSYLIIWRCCSDQCLWWFRTMVWLLKLCYRLKDLRMQRYCQRKWFSCTNLQVNSWVNRITTISVCELSNLYLWWQDNSNEKIHQKMNKSS